MKKTACVKFVYTLIFPRRTIKWNKKNLIKARKKIKKSRAMRRKKKRLLLVKIYIRKLLRKQKLAHLLANQY